jgi:hypothetical protein
MLSVSSNCLYPLEILEKCVRCDLLLKRMKFMLLEVKPSVHCGTTAHSKDQQQQQRTAGKHCCGTLCNSSLFN